ncbi:universal stress protein [Halobellus rarus]|uniref:Universal stress protein n=1 Tax=Halobellus rarus TaxID=1126237 RepID=A0ABD6CSH8_9EURY
MYDQILVPTDGSQGAEAALEHGIESASKWDATLDPYTSSALAWRAPVRCSKRFGTKDAGQYEMSR